MAVSWPIKPVSLAGDDSTSFERPYESLSAEGFAGPVASGFVPVADHGCSVLLSLLRAGEEGGLDCFLSSFSKVLLTNVRDLYVIFLFHGILSIILYRQRC